jgi:phosphonate metabolism protein PhnN/1,5-bisphosphokinase (PRPP-forming)
MAGRLILVVGPSGVGKDTLLGGARQELAGRGFVFPRRLITRPAEAGGEDHVALTSDDFAAAKARGDFALSWSAHGNDYAVPGSIRSDLTAGRHVVVNVSRMVIDEARRTFPRVRVVAVSAPRDVLAARLAERGREDAAAVARRLDRAAAYQVTGDDVIAVSNDGTVEEGIRRFVAALETLAGT